MPTAAVTSDKIVLNDARLKESWARGVEWELSRMVYPNYVGGSTFKPRYTAEEMKVEAAKEGKTFYSYELVCNKICGASHYKMRFPIVVLEQKDFDAKMKAAKTFGDEIVGN